MSDFNTLARLADRLYSRFEAKGDPSDLSLCIVRYRSALTLAELSTTLSSDTRSMLFCNLASALSIRFQRHGDMADLDHSVECHFAALDLRPPGHPGRAKTLSNYATALLVRYSQLGVQNDVELAIEHFNAALPLLPPGGRLIPLMNYASALLSRFQHSGDVSDLNDAIRQYRAVVDYSPGENKSTSCYNLANALLSRFKLENDPKDLELSIEYSSIALQGMSESHPDRLLALSCLSTALVKRFESYGDAEDLETAVKNLMFVLERQSIEGAPQYIAFSDLANALVLRYKSQSDLADLELAVDHYRTALDLLSADSDSENEKVLGNLGHALFLRFSRLGRSGDLEEAIQKYYLASEAHSEDLSQHIITLEALGTCLDVRFEQFGDPRDLDTIIEFYNEALVGAPQDHPHRAAILTKCASGLERRFRLYGRIIDLDRSISYCRGALELQAPGHPDRAASYQALASLLLLRFEETGDEFDLDEACFSCNTSMSVQCTSDSSRAACNLLLARISKARILPWEVRDIELILQHLRTAKDLCTLTSPLISDVYAELASAHYLRFLREQRPSDLHEALGLHELSMNVANGPLWPAFRASLQWVRDAEIYGHRSGVDAYRCTLRLIERHVLALRSPELRQCFARRYCFDLASSGASFALRFQSPTEAIEILESGRSVAWSQLVRARTCLDDLRLMGEDEVSLADDFERLTLQLERVSSASDSSSCRDVKPLLKEKEAVVQQIRRVEGFRAFLRSASFPDLEKAATDGPVVLLNACRRTCTCDALIVFYNMLPVHVPLSDMTTPDDLSQMATRFRELTTGSVDGGDNNQGALEGLLSELWDAVVFPVVQHVLPYAPRGSRLWWCPTGVFASLPLHAAGPYGGGAPGMPQLYVSSYTPTLQALIRAKRMREVPRARRASIVPALFRSKQSKRPPSVGSSTMMPTIVAIGHTASDETCHDLDLLRNRIPPRVPFRRMEGGGGSEVSSEAVLAAFRERPVWLHLACPASLDADGLPCRSGFVIGKDDDNDNDGRGGGIVSLRDISNAPVLAEFAFLSGRCRRRRRRSSSSSTGGEDTQLEETMHLAASLQYSGVRSVVGTLWSVDDEVMRRVTSAFYEQVLLKAGGSMHHTNTAQSLHEALAALGEQIPLAHKIAFVHVGA